MRPVGSDVRRLAVAFLCLFLSWPHPPSDIAHADGEGGGSPSKSEGKGDAKGQGPSAKAAEKPGEARADTPPAPPAPAKSPATSLILTVKLALMADPRLFPFELDVDTKGETAVLSGKVSTEVEKAAAAEVAQTVEGIKSVTNNIEVVKDLQRTLARKRDEAMTQYVKDRFQKSKTLETAHFDVKTEDGIVTLSGKTRFQVIVLEAAEAARQVPGVRAVKSDTIRIEADD